MKRLPFLLLALAPLVFPGAPLLAASAPQAQVVAPAGPSEAARALIARVVPAHAAQFSVEIIPAAENGHDVFEVESVGGKVVLRGNDGVSVASALNWYLKEIAHNHLSWCGDRIELPVTLAPVPAKVRVVNPHKYRVMYNYCTLNYTASWWDQQRWERELDFIAMQGVNTPLGAIGLEAVWYDTLLKHGFSDIEARAFLAGPAYSAWQWLANIEGAGGPLPRSWIESHRALGKWWFDRARSLGMTPIRQGFSGYVPRSSRAKFPGASIAIQSAWCGFPGSAQLDPLDPLFNKLGRTFMEESVRNYGEGHLWAADPFHESFPPRPGEKYLNEVGAAIFSLMKEVDPKAIWAMQSWDIRKPITDPVPKGELLVFDIGGGRNDFWGHDYVKGQLHNFGGRINMHGDLRDIAANKFAGRAAVDPKCVGLGLFPESIVQNPVFYETVHDVVWRDKPVEIESWLHDYALRRYGVADAGVDTAWKLLLDEGPYQRKTSGTEASSMICARPALEAKKSGPNNGFVMPYKPEKLVEALDLLSAVSDRAGASDAYRYDIVDITRQVLTNLSQNLHKEVRLAYLNHDRAAFDKATAEFEIVLADVDTLLATRPEFLYGKWVADARSWSDVPEEKALYERNAAMLVTIWGPDKKPEIFDYSWREWSGLISRYYLPRWKQFHAFLRESVDKGDYRDPKPRTHGRESFRANDFYKQLAEWELAFLDRTNSDLPAAPAGDALAVARTLLQKHRAQLQAMNTDAYRASLENRLKAAGPAGVPQTIRLGKWAAKDIPAKGKTFTFDASKAVAADGEYDIEFVVTSGAASDAVEFGPVELLLNGDKVATAPGVFKLAPKAPAKSIRIKSGENLINGKFEVRVLVKPSRTTPELAGEITATKTR